MFDFIYETEVPVPVGTKTLALWLPYPASDEHQKIEGLSIQADYPTDVRKEPKYANSILYLKASPPRDGVISLTMSFRVKRSEYVRKDFARVKAQIGALDPDVRRWLEPDRLVPIDDYVRGLAFEVTRGRTSVLEKAQAIYDYTVDTLQYDKSGTGWGNGDIYYACDAKRGNCTDFHAVFIGFARALGIPAKFAIGFPIPQDSRHGEISGYHCWAEFYAPGYGWVPVDTSEANKHPEKREYFFGAHDENRVELTVGRDIALSPPQSGELLNYFIYPYAEADGRPVKSLTKRFRFKDLPAIESGAVSAPSATGLGSP